MNMPALPAATIEIARVEAFAFRCPIEQPVVTSFGTMRDRPAVFVRVEDREGAVGWGEVWCNFPACGAEHRAQLVDTVLAPLICGRSFDSPAAAFRELTSRTRVLAIQCGEPGSLAQAIAGMDIAMWDLAARRAKLPLWRVLGGASGKIQVYASGINPRQPEELVAEYLQGGYRAFKIKVGFEPDLDRRNLRAVRDLLGESSILMADANQGWTLEAAKRFAPPMAEVGLHWLEEPLRADTHWAEWGELLRAGSPALAAGENVAGVGDFERLLADSPVSFVQPDVAKWGGISGCWSVISSIQVRQRTYCPHYLGGGIGLLASGHLLAASGGGGLLEVDANPNSLRTLIAPQFQRADTGWCELPDSPGVGAVVDFEELNAWRTYPVSPAMANRSA